jgi:hypothetical protein
LWGVSEASVRVTAQASQEESRYGTHAQRSAAQQDYGMFTAYNSSKYIKTSSFFLKETMSASITKTNRLMPYEN